MRARWTCCAAALLVPCSVSVRRLRWTSGQQVSAQEGAGGACHGLRPIGAAVIDSQWQIRGGEYGEGQERGDLIDKLLFLSWLLETGFQLLLTNLCLKATCW